MAGGVGQDEVDRARAQLRASLVMARESVSGCGDALARQITLFGKPTDDAELLDQIDDVTEDRVSSVAADMIAGGDSGHCLDWPGSRDHGKSGACRHFCGWPCLILRVIWVRRFQRRPPESLD